MESRCCAALSKCVGIALSINGGHGEKDAKKQSFENGTFTNVQHKTAKMKHPVTRKDFSLWPGCYVRRDSAKMAFTSEMWNHSLTMAASFGDCRPSKWRQTVTHLHLPVKEKKMEWGRGCSRLIAILGMLSERHAPASTIIGFCKVPVLPGEQCFVYVLQLLASTLQ